MISTEERNPSSGGDQISNSNNTSSSRLNSYQHSHQHHHHPHNNNHGEENSLYYQYIPSPSSFSSSPPSHDDIPLPSSRITPASSTPTIHIESSPPSSPVLRRQVNQIVLRDPHLHHNHQHPHNPHHSYLHHSSPAVNQLGVGDHFHYHHHPQQHLQSSSALNSSNSTVALPRSSSTSGITDFIQHHLSSRLLPKLGSIVKRFNLNYSGEGLLSDRQRTRTVRVGIRFQVQVDSFVGQQDHQRPRAILRTQSAPAVEQLDSGFSSPTEVFPQNNRQLAALEYQTEEKSSNSNSNSTSSSISSTSSFGQEGAGNARIIIGGDTSSGVSSEATSPVLNRRQQQLLHHQHEQSLQHQPSSSTLAFHNRINQALHSYRRTQQQKQQGSPVGSPPSSSESFFGRSFPTFRRGTSTPTEGSIPNQETQRMEDSSSYQVLRHFPGSNVNSLNELNWETAAFEKEIRDRIQWIGDKISSLRVPRVITQLIDFGKEYARENPVSALILLALCLTSSAPVFIFLVFAVATILVTFLGFLFVEGTLLTVATVIFGGVILVVGFVTLSAVLLGMLGYFTTTQAYLVLTGRSRIFQLLRKLPIIGRLFPEPPSRKSSTSRSGSGHVDEEISKLLEGMANGGAKVSNGYHHHDSAIDYEDDILDDSELEEEDETTAGVVATSDSDLGLENGMEDEDEDELDEDLGANQEVISENKQPSPKFESNKAKKSGKSSSLSNSSSSVASSPAPKKKKQLEKKESSPEATSTPSPGYLNGHGQTHEELDTSSENSEL